MAFWYVVFVALVTVAASVEECVKSACREWGERDGDCCAEYSDASCASGYTMTFKPYYSWEDTSRSCLYQNCMEKGHGGNTCCISGDGTVEAYSYDDECYGSAHYEEVHHDKGDDAALLIIIIYMAIYLGVFAGVGTGTGIAFCYAHTQRQILLTDAKQGRPVEQPSNCWKYCCGACAVYYWEGCSVNYLITYCLFAWFAICCWQPTPMPMENGVMIMVGPPIGVGQAPMVVGQAVVGQVVGQVVQTNKA